MAVFTTVPIPGNATLDVVGESHYMTALQGALEQGRDHHVILVPEVGNPYGSNAVRVDLLVDGQPVKVGYLPSEESSVMRPHLERLAKRRQVAGGVGRLRGGTDRAPNIGVVVDPIHTPFQIEVDRRYLGVAGPRRRVNHVGHLIGTIFTGGLWLFVWIPVAVRARRT